MSHYRYSYNPPTRYGNQHFPNQRMVYQGFYDRNIMAMASAEYAYYDFGKKQVEFSNGEFVDNKIIFQGFTLGLSWKF